MKKIMRGIFAENAEKLAIQRATSENKLEPWILEYLLLFQAETIVKKNEC